MRGFGAPQVCFAHEAQMDKLARALGMDPVVLRLQNALVTGSVLPTGQVIEGSAPVREVIEACRAIKMPEVEPDAGRSPLHYPGGTGNVTRGEGLKRGVGFAVGYKNVGFSEGFDDAATARVTIRLADGLPEAEIHTAAVEMGQGLYTLLTQIVRTELDVDRVVMHPTDTLIGDAGSASASRLSTMAGGAVQLACSKIREGLFARARSHLEATESFATNAGDLQLSLQGGWVHAGEQPLIAIRDLVGDPLSEVAIYHHRRTGELDERGQGDVHVYFTFAAERAVVEVDEELGLVRVLQIAAAIDAGRVVNPIGFSGQVEGGTAQGLGFALMEEVQLADGVIRNASFTDYLIPTILDMPPVSITAVEVPEPSAPYGLKGMGESPTIVATAAVMAALRDATGRELNHAPVSIDELVGIRGPATTSGPPPVPEVPGQLSVPFYLEMSSGQQRLM